MRSEELRLVLLEAFNGDQVSKELTTLDKLHQEVNPVLVLEDVLHVDKEGVIDSVQNIFFKLDVVHLLIL